jgi:hypothetical protein
MDERLHWPVEMPTGSHNKYEWDEMVGVSDPRCSCCLIEERRAAWQEARS